MAAIFDEKGNFRFNVNEKVFAKYSRKDFKAYIKRFHPNYLDRWEELYPGKEPAKVGKADVKAEGEGD